MPGQRSLPVRAYELLIKGATALQPLVLLGMRLYWGWQFHLAGAGKLHHIDRTTEFFTSLHLPFPRFNVYLAASTECFGGLLLLLGLGSRLVAIPLIFTMCVAYATADRESLLALWPWAQGVKYDPDKFVSAAPFLFLLCCVIVLAFGPGPLSIDGLLKRWFNRRKNAA